MSNKKKNNNPSQKLFDFYAGNLHLILIFLVSFIFYGNSLSNETALDDVMVLTNNQFVLKGISGIPDIISHESFFGATGKITAALSWRYRPLSLLLFAFEHEFFGNSWTAYHFFNVFFYTVLCMVIYNFFRRHVFKSNSHYALTAALLFSIHPMHTEVVANIKSLDEILALLFSVLFLDSLLKQSLSKSKLEIFKSLLYLLLALMSKESSTLLLALAPIALYVFNGDTIKDRKSTRLTPVTL